MWNTRPYTLDSASFALLDVSPGIFADKRCVVAGYGLRTLYKNVYPVSPDFRSSRLPRYFLPGMPESVPEKRAWPKIGKIGTKTVVQARLLQKQQ